MSPKPSSSETIWAGRRRMARNTAVTITSAAQAQNWPSGPIRLCLQAPAAGFAAGEQTVPVPVQSRQELYELLAAPPAAEE